MTAVVRENVSRPLVSLWYFIDHAIWGPAPFGYHVTSVLLHMLNVALLFLFTRGVAIDRLRDEGMARERRAVLAAGVAATLFAVHPMMTEAVGYISGRSDLLSGTFMLLSFVTVRQWLNTDRSLWLMVALAAFFLALSAKETAIVLPVLFLYYILLVRNDPPAARRRHLIMLCVPLLAIAIVGASVRLGLFVFVEYAGAVGWQWRFALSELDVFTRYLALMIAPVGQTIFHGVPATTSFLEPRAIVAMTTTAICVALILLAARRRSIGGFGLAWFVLMLLPSAILVLLNRAEPMAERRVYFASAGLFLAAGTRCGRRGDDVRVRPPFHASDRWRRPDCRRRGAGRADHPSQPRLVEPDPALDGSGRADPESLVATARPGRVIPRSWAARRSHRGVPPRARLRRARGRRLRAPRPVSARAEGV